MQMDPLGVVTGIREECIDQSALTRFSQGLFEMKVIRTGPASRHGREDQVRAALGQEPDLGKAPIGHVLQAFVAARSPADKIVTDVVGLEAAAIDGG
jgi:hypothetical protein